MASEEKSDFEPFDRKLSMLLFAPPLIWLAHLTISYALVPESCVSGEKWFLHLVTVVALVLALAATAASWSGYGNEREGSLDAGGETDTRRRFMMLSSVAFGLLFTLLILANQIPIFILRSCD